MKTLEHIVAYLILEFQQQCLSNFRVEFCWVYAIDINVKVFQRQLGWPVRDILQENVH